MRPLPAPSSLAKRPYEPAGLLLQDEGFQAAAQEYRATAPDPDAAHDDSAYHEDESDEGALDTDINQDTSPGALVPPDSPWAMSTPALPLPLPLQHPGAAVQNYPHPHPDSVAASDNADMSDSEGEGGAPLGSLAMAATAPMSNLPAPALALDYDSEIDEPASSEDSDEDYDDEYDDDYDDDDDDDYDDAAEDDLTSEEDQHLSLSDFENSHSNFPFYPPGIAELNSNDTLLEVELPPAAWPDPLNDDLPDATDEEFAAGILSNPAPNVLGPADPWSYDLPAFLDWWEHLGPREGPRPQRPQALAQYQRRPSEVRYSDLKGDRCDYQGLDWTAMGITRKDARTMRPSVYENFVNHVGSDAWNPGDILRLPHHEDFFRFKKMSIRRDVSLAHFQLRSVLACPSRSRAYYSSPEGIMCFNHISRKTELAINARDFSLSSARISTLDAGCGVLMGGTLHGDYCVRAIESESKAFDEGRITSATNSFTNHLKIHTPRRSSNPVAAIASNDSVFRVLDIETQRFVSENMYRYPLNCSAVSPDRQLRVAVGDDLNALILNSENGEILQELTGHRDYVFACDWNDDGWTVATSSQDKSVKIWDARRWCNSDGVSTPLCTIVCELAGARNLRFSPSGSGKRVLVAAESADYINLIDAQTFTSKQTFDIFSEIGGVSFTNDGQDLTILCNDGFRGGLFQLERCGRGPEPQLEDEMVLWPTAEGWRGDNEKRRWARGSSAATRSTRRPPAMREALNPF